MLRNWAVFPLVIGLAGCAVGAEDTLFDALGQETTAAASVPSETIPADPAAVEPAEVAASTNGNLMNTEEQAATVNYLQSLANAPKVSRSALSTNARALEALGASHGQTALSEIENPEPTKN